MLLNTERMFVPASPNEVPTFREDSLGVANGSEQHGCAERKKATRGPSVLILIFLSGFFRPALAQTSTPLPETPQPPPRHLEREISWKHLLPNVATDEKQIWWEFPKGLAHGKHWLPTSAVLVGTAGLIALDSHDEPYFRRTDAFHGFNRVMSFNGTIVAMAAVPTTTYLIGLAHHDVYAQQTAELTAEALIDAGVPGLVIKDIARRVPPSKIPLNGNFSDSWFRDRRGPFNFGPGGFPSGHTLAAFSIATIFADRYRHHHWVRWVAFAGAGAIAFSRITKQAHFASDVFAGAILGHTTAHFVVIGCE